MDNSTDHSQGITIPEGAFDLGGLTPRDAVHDWLHWLREHYDYKGWSQDRLGDDILAFGVSRNMLTDTTFGDLAAYYGYRLCVMHDDAMLGAANENDPLKVEAERFEKSKLPFEVSKACLNHKPFTDGHFPRVQWRPFALVSRVRSWPRTQLYAALRRGPPYH